MLVSAGRQDWRTHRTQIEKLSDCHINVYVDIQWIRLLDEGDCDRMSLGCSSEAPDYLIVLAAKNVNGRGRKPSRYKNGSVKLTLRADELLMKRLFPNPNVRECIPKEVVLMKFPDGTKGVGLECPGSSEYVADLGLDQETLKTLGKESSDQGVEIISESPPAVDEAKGE